MIPKQLQNDKIKFCRVRFKTKKPFEKDWTNKPYTHQEIKEFFPKENYGVLCGHGDLAVIDCDNEALTLAIEGLLPKTFKVKTGSGGSHFYFFVPNLKQKIILEVDDTHLGEVQSYGTQVVGAGSTHPNGKKYEVEEDIEISTIACEDLLDFLKPFRKEIKQVEDNVNYERQTSSEIDNLSVVDIWGTSGLKDQGGEYYGEHPIHGSSGGMNFWINPSKNMWHCFRCNSGGGVLSAIAVKEGIINCSEAQKGNLRGDKAKQAIEVAKEKYGLKDESPETQAIELPENKNEDKIEVIWDKDLKNHHEEEKDWIIDRLIPKKSVCILSGKRGTLKTFITLSMAYSIAAGDDFLDKFPTQKGKVVYLDKENGVSIMKTRTSMIKKGLGLQEKDFDVGFICFSQLKIDKMKDMAKLDGVIEKFKPSLLVVDTYRRGISFDENDAGKVSELFVDVLRPLVEKNDLSIILIHHNRKGHGEGDEMDEIRGSSDLANYADIIVKLERKGNNLIFKQLKNRNAPEEKPIQIKTEFGENGTTPYVKMLYEGEFMKQSKVDKCIEALTIWIAEKELKQFKTKEAKEIAFKGGHKETTFKSALKEMENIGKLESSVFGLYDVLD